MTAETSAIVAPSPTELGRHGEREEAALAEVVERVARPTNPRGRGGRPRRRAPLRLRRPTPAGRGPAAPVAGGVIVMVIMSIEHRDEYESLPVRDLDPTGTDSGLHPAA